MAMLKLKKKSCVSNYSEMTSLTVATFVFITSMKLFS